MNFKTTICCALFFLLIIFQAGKAAAQQIDLVKVTLETNEQTSIINILKNLEKQIPYKFVYDPEEAAKIYKPWGYNYHNQPLGKLLSILGFSYQIESTFIILKRKVKPEKISQKDTITKSAEKIHELLPVYVIGYGVIEPHKVTSSITKITKEQFHQGGVTSPLDLIRGKVAGLSITRTGGNNNPNQVSAIQLRGVTTLSTTPEANQPLIVIDGIPGGNLDLLQEDDILAFDVLKDGSAAAIYGTRGNTGVILISTKKGIPGSALFEYSSYWSHDQASKYPGNLSANRYRTLMNDTENQYSGFMIDYGDNQDYYKLLLNNKNLSQYQYLAASGGTQKSNYRASIFYVNREGIAKQNTNNQYGGRININQKGLKKLLDLQFNLSTNIKKSNLNGGNSSDFEQALQQNPTQPVFETNGDYFYTSGVNYYNPVTRLNQEKKNTDAQIISGDVKITLKLLPSLNVNVGTTITRNNNNIDEYYDKNSKYSIDYTNGSGYAYKGSLLNVSQSLEYTVNYHKTIGHHSFTTLGGYSYQKNTNSSFSAANSGFLTDAFQNNNLNDGTYLTGGRAAMNSNKNTSKLIAFFGRINYSLQDKYMAAFTLRHEGSSRFGKNHRWGNFPAFSVGWNVGKEHFMEIVKAVDELKIRLGYGVTGNETIPNYQSLVTLSGGGQYLNNGQWFQTYGPDKNPNPDLRWEKKSEFNLGIDFSLLKKALTGNIDIYRRVTDDLLAEYNTQIPGYVSPKIYTNVGTIENKGIELTLNARLLQKDGFQWNLTFLGNTQRNKLLSISDDVFKASYFQYGNLPAPGSLGYAIRTIEGGSLGNFYGKRFAGFNEQGKWLFYKANGTIGTAAEMNTNDLTNLGNGVPKYMSSLGSTLTYNRFDFSLFFRGKFVYKILNLQHMYYGNTKWLGNNILESALTTKSKLDDDPQFSDYYLENGNFVKLDNITVGYTVTFKHTIKKLRCYLSGQNLAVFTNYTGMDPEVQDTGLTTGIDSRSFYPPTKTFTLGFRLEF